jgi:phosphatidylserine/phosphatidylglycerophosphate/cardiolipin synthase-like enzyme
MDEAVELAAVLLECDEVRGPEAQSRLLRTLLGDVANRGDYDPLLLRRLEGLLGDDVVSKATAVHSAAAALSAASNRSRPVSDQWDLVLTAPVDLPRRHGIRRRTGATLRIAIAAARKRVRLYSPFITAPGIAMLAEALEVACSHGADIELTAPETAHVPHLLTDALPDLVRRRTTVREVRVGLQQWPHLKVVTVDGTRAYVGSANLTAPGLGGGNLELGVLIDGEQVRAIDALLDLILEPLP